MASKRKYFRFDQQSITPGILLRRLLHRVERSKLLGLSIAGVMLVLVGLLDYFTGNEVGFALFYLFPVMLGTWAAGRWAGFAIATISALLWLFTDLTTGHNHQPLSPFWNAAMRLGIFTLVAQLVIHLKNMIEFERAVSRTDHLTGAANRRAFIEALGSESNRSNRFQHTFSLVYIDVDNFKQLNDSEGHKTGDEALRVIAETLNRNLRNVDLVGRIGGDEFAILLPECGKAAASEVVSRCFAACSREIRARNWPIGLSMGVGIFNQSDRTVDELLACADKAMYQSKCLGKNRIHYVNFEEQVAGTSPPNTVECDEKSRSVAES